MELKCLWLYSDMMDLYGDKGNIQTLKYRCEKRGIKFTLDTCTIGETKTFSDYDLIFMGGGADKEQNILSKDLLEKKSEVLDAIDKGAFFLLICGGYQLFGKSYVDAMGRDIPGLALFDYKTVAPNATDRCVGNVIIEANLDGKKVKVVGFENHGGQTQGVDMPFGEVLYGHGNMYKSKYEGFYNGQILGTYIHGPLLPKNSELADFVITKALSRRYENVNLEPLSDVFEKKAVETILNRYLKK